MFNKIGTLELLVILVVALFVIGPEKLPGVAKSIGKMLGTARHYLKDIMDDVQAEVKSVEEDLKEVETSLKSAKDVLVQPLKEPDKGEEKGGVVVEIAQPADASGPEPAEILPEEIINMEGI